MKKQQVKMFKTGIVSDYEDTIYEDVNNWLKKWKEDIVARCISQSEAGSSFVISILYEINNGSTLNERK